MKRLQQLFEHKKQNVLNIYTTAGYPELASTVPVALALAEAGADLIELGMPYSDPMADGETIQLSSAQALANGMTLNILFDQVVEIRKKSQIPIVLMGYLNQLIQYGVENFLQKCQEVGVDGLIIPDLPMDIYENQYKALMDKYELGFSFLVTPQTSDERCKKADSLSSGFLYVVSQASITGSSGQIADAQIEYFKRLQQLNLKAPQLIGFGIHDHKTFSDACQYSNGAIIGSAFIRHIAGSVDISKSVHGFVQGIVRDC